MPTEVKISWKRFVNPKESAQWRWLTLKKRKWHHYQTNSGNGIKEQTSAIFAKKSSNINTLMIKIIVKLKNIIIILVNTELLHMAYVIRNIVCQKKFLWFFTMNQTITAWKVSKYGVISGPHFPVFGPEITPYWDTFHVVHDYHFIIKELAKALDGEFNCFGENTEKCKTFSVPVTREVKKIGENEEEIRKAIHFKLQFIGSARFMASLLSNFVGKLAEGIHKIKSKYGYDNKKCGKFGIKNKYC